MKITFRVDAGHEIGAGHVIRCLTLADELKQRGHQISFISREIPGNYCDYIEGKGYIVHRLPSCISKEGTSLAEINQFDAAETIKKIKFEKFDWLIVDHYKLDDRWEKEVRPYFKRLMVIDDLANRPHICDILIDQDIYEDSLERYVGLVNKDTLLLLGVEFAILRSQFRKARETLRKRTGEVIKLFVGFGGSDLSNSTLKTLQALRLFHSKKILTNVVVGQANVNKDSIAKFCKEESLFSYNYQIENVAELMTKSDLAIGAGGTMTWERCCLGLPSIVITIADNQRLLNQMLAKEGVILHLGDDAIVTIDYMQQTLQAIMEDRKKLLDMGQKGMELVDGKGSIRIVNALENF